MNSELKQAAQQALKALNNAVPEDTKQAREQFDAIQALRTALQQATQPAEVTDEQIAACVKRASTYGLPFVGLLNPGGTPSDFSKRFTVEILALRPVQVPMTMRERVEVFERADLRMGREPNLSWRHAIVEETEKHHGIKPKEQA